jgi:hypothetical protein
MTAAVTKDAKPVRYTINISLGNDGDDEYVFVGGTDEGDFRIKRGQNVTVPRSVVERLENAVIGVPERDQSAADGVRFVERKRFPFTIINVA